MSGCRRFVVSGRVQGVFFRAGTQDVARHLGLTGWVRNRSDGCVELIACGEAGALAKLEQWLWQGPPQARVARVEAGDVDGGPFARFEVTG
jgi:acylphosphatase